jgi:hypothetical protein
MVRLAMIVNEGHLQKRLYKRIVTNAFNTPFAYAITARYTTFHFDHLAIIQLPAFYHFIIGVRPFRY